MSSRPPKPKPQAAKVLTRAEEGMAVVLAGAQPSEKRKLVNELVAEKKGIPTTLPAKARRGRIESEIRRKSGRTQDEVDATSVELYDELAALGMLEPR